MDLLLRELDRDVALHLAEVKAYRAARSPFATRSDEVDESEPALASCLTRSTLEAIIAAGAMTKPAQLVAFRSPF